MARVKKVDARSISSAAQEDLRRRVVAAVVEQKLKHEDAARLFGVSVRSVSKWVNAFARNGNRALKARKRGQKPGVQQALTPKMQAQIKRIVRHRMPEQETLPGLVWTRPQVKKLIFARFGIALSKQTVSKYLRAWGLSPQKPIRKAYEQDPHSVDEWLSLTYPAIEQQAAADDGMIVWIDQTGFRSDAAVGVTWADEGATPVVPKTGQRFGVNACCAITNQGHLYFTVYEGSFTSTVMIDFCRRLISTFDQKIHLIVDGHGTHKSKATTAWMNDHAGDIVMHYLPGYSPELNPVEIGNADIKPQVAQHDPANRTELAHCVRTVLRRIQRLPDRVRSWFGKPEVTYAAQ